MKSNPGGQLSPAEVLGRDALIRRLWKVLEGRSLILSAERRMGKTCLVKKMTAEVPGNHLAIYRDLEKVHTTLEFAELLFHDVEAYLSGLRRTAENVRQFLSHLEGAEVGRVVKFPKAISQHWKDLVAKTVEDLTTNQDRKLVFFWDEVPLMLYKIKQNEGEAAAMELLDLLRSLRQTHPDLKMIFTGSIGLHNVISFLKRAGYANDPTNDMDLIEVPPLTLTDATELARRLLIGEELEVGNLVTTCEAITREVDCIPYFIHHVVDQLTQLNRAIDPDVVHSIVHECIADENDRWHLHYYRERINIYYEASEKQLAVALLDAIAVATDRSTFEDIFNRVKGSLVIEDRDITISVLTHLRRDHYVAMDGDGRYDFRFPLIKRFWRLHRGLES